MRDEVENGVACRHALRLIYDSINLEWIKLHDAQARRLFGASHGANLPAIDVEQAYREVFTADCKTWTRSAFGDAMLAMKGRPLADCESDLGLLAFLQHVFAVALWKFRLPLDARLEDFTRDFDRLDVEQERSRLHAHAQG